jgi:hypothetical protein
MPKRKPIEQIVMKQKEPHNGLVEYHDWYVTSLPLWLDRAGRNCAHPTVAWIVVRCNNPQCDAWTIVHPDLVIKQCPPLDEWIKGGPNANG